MRSLILAFLVLAGCAEMRVPAPAAPPFELAAGFPPLPAPEIARRAALDFDGQGARLEGRPAEAAIAAARLEWLAQAMGEAGPLADFPDSFRFVTRRAVEEVRQSLAIRAEAPPQQVIAALVEASRALRAGRAPVLEAPVFRDATPPPARRLAEPGPLPNAALATGAIAEEMARRAPPRDAFSPSP